MLWLQHRLLCLHCPEIRRPAIRRNENGGLHLPDLRRCAVPDSDDRGTSLPANPSGMDSDPGKCDGRLQTLSADLHSQRTLRICLQHRHRHLHGSGGLQNTLSVSGSVLRRQCGHGYSLCHRVPDGSTRSRLGHLHLPGHQRSAGIGADSPENPGDSLGKGPPLLCRRHAPHRRGSHPQYVPAGLHLRGQHSDPEHYQSLWLRGHCRLFRRGEAEQSGDHLLHHHRKRHLQLHRPEHRRRKSAPGSGGLPLRAADGVAHQYSAVAAVFLRRTFSHPVLSG